VICVGNTAGRWLLADFCKKFISITFSYLWHKELTTMNKFLKGVFILAAGLLISCGTVREKRTVVLIKTEFGDMKVELYNETPKHRDNFLKLVKEGYYDGVLFHRVIKEFMIQGGDPDSRNAKPDQQLGNGGPDYTIDAEINPKFLHKKGALAAARMGDEVNPGKKSSGSQFYIVQGLVFPGNDLPALEAKGNEKLEQSYMRQLTRDNVDSLKFYQQSGNQVALAILMDSLHSEALAKVEKTPFKLTDEQKAVYTTVGGTPHLDGNYTVFGQVIEGLSVIDAIAAQPTGQNDRPQKDIKMEIKVIQE
jgi:cyclophilin family peptidyl-prolyl cis-trans isomerase